MKKFRTVHYTVHMEKIQEKKGPRFAVLADLHGMEFGQDNQILLDAIDRHHPDGILIAGDMIVRCSEETFPVALRLLKNLVEKYPVYYGLGNHEYCLYASDPEENPLTEKYLEYEIQVKEAGVHILHNEQKSFRMGETLYRIYGLEIPRLYYKKPFAPMMRSDEVEQLIGDRDEQAVNILLAHNPRYGDAYFGWGADLILSGHYHGGVLRFTRCRGAISPQFELFPRYCCGDFHKKGQHMLVSGGIGEHTIPVRVHNPRELLIVDLKPGSGKKSRKEEHTWEFR